MLVWKNCLDFQILSISKYIEINNIILYVLVLISVVYLPSEIAMPLQSILNGPLLHAHREVDCLVVLLLANDCERRAGYKHILVNHLWLLHV